MNPVRALYCSVCGSFGVLLFAPTALTQADITKGSIGTNPVETSSVDTSAIDEVDECMVAQICIDRYLWSRYERTRKIDTIKVSEQTKVTVKRKGKTRVVTQTITKLVDEDFTWKDPKAAERAGMSPRDYVIGGMDPSFRVTLYHALRALDDAGLMPGITCAFRDDYRQTIATGQKAQSDRSYHGGSFRGGYGHGVAADIVSIKGETRAERLASSGELWKWIDAHEKELGIGRPYLDRDPPHVAPIDGEEYAKHRVERNTQQAESKSNTHPQLALRNDRSMSKHATHRVEWNTQQAESKAKTHPQLALHNDHSMPKHATHRVERNTQQAESKAKMPKQLALHNDHSMPKRARAARPPRAQSRPQAHSI
jgi:hypothetical protein